MARLTSHLSTPFIYAESAGLAIGGEWPVTTTLRGGANDQSPLAQGVPGELGVLERPVGQASASDGKGADNALFRFTDRLFRSHSLSDVCDAALDAIREALGCERASILILDNSDVMRFVSWRGLSDDYRRAVEGHSPWTKDTKDPQPTCIEDIDRRQTLPEELKAIVKAEGIGALAFVPLVAKGELIGKFMTYYDAPHVFSGTELDLAVTIARQLGFSFERMQRRRGTTCGPGTIGVGTRCDRAAPEDQHAIDPGG